MVDAIGSVTSQQIKPAKKDNAINWKQCTSDEIIEYEKEGQEIPSYILEWARDFAKQQNAPEDVTYEMAMGATTMAGVNPNQQAESGSENSEDEPTAAEALRQQMTTEGVSIRTQAKTFRGYSDQYTSEIQNLMDSMEEYMAQSEAAAAAAEDTRDDVMTRIQTLIASKKQTNTGDVSGALQAARIDNQIRSVGQAGMSSIESLAQPIDTTETNITAAEFTSLTGRGYGNETVKIASDPALNDNFIGHIIASITNRAGEKELKTSDKGDQQFAENRGQNDGYDNDVKSSQDEIRRASGATVPKGEGESDVKDAADKADSDKTVNDSENDQVARESDTKKEELAQNDPDTVDEKITTDPNEILKRKERKGLV